MSSCNLKAPLLFIAPMKRVFEINAVSISLARPAVMNWRSFRPRYAEVFVSKEMRSLLRSRIVGEADVGGVGIIWDQFVFGLGTGVVGIELRLEALAGSVPVMVRVIMWMAPQRISIWRVRRAVVARSRIAWIVLSKATTDSSVMGR